jgi:hypothetical protein
VTNFWPQSEFDFRLSRIGTNAGFARTNGLADFLGLDLYTTQTNAAVNANAP